MPTDQKLTQKDAVTVIADTDIVYVVQGVGGTPVVKKSAWSLFKSTLETYFVAHTKKLRGLISNPQAIYTQRPQIFMMLTDAAITVTRIHVHNSVTSREIAGDIKYADDMNTGSFANAVVVQAIDTTSGAFTKTSSFTHAGIPSGKYVYLLLDASPHVDIKDIYVEVFYTYD